MASEADGCVAMASEAGVMPTVVRPFLTAGSTFVSPCGRGVTSPVAGERTDELADCVAAGEGREEPPAFVDAAAELLDFAAAELLDAADAEGAAAVFVDVFAAEL